MLNSIVYEHRIAKVWRCEDLTARADDFLKFVSNITADGVSVDPAWGDTS